MVLRGYAIFKEKVIGGLKNNMSENVHFDGLVLSKPYKVLDEKLQKSYVS